MHDPFAMRPFFGYNFGHYLSHWLSMKNRSQNLPKIFHVNWFRKSTTGSFLWPGFGENSRVLDWVLRRIENEDCATQTPVGLVPKKGALHTSDLKKQLDFDQLFGLDKDFWTQEVQSVKKYFDEQVGADLPKEIMEQLNALKKRVSQM